MALEWILFGIGSAGAIVYGVVRHRPARIGPWILLAGAIASLAAGDVLWALDLRDIADICYYANYALVVVGLLQLTRAGAFLVDRARLIDFSAFGCSMLLVVWVFVIAGRAQVGQIPAADVIGDLLLVGVAAWLLGAAGRNASATLLLIGAVGVLCSDVAYGLHEGWASEIGYMVLYVAWGLAALHPSMTRLTEPMPVRPSPWRARWAALLGISVLTPPVVLLIEAVTGTVRDGVVIAVVSAVTLTLAITRLTDSITLTSQALARERALRGASAALVAAADESPVDDAVRAAIGELMPAQAVRKVVFATDDRHLPLATVPPDDDRPQSRSWWVEDSDDTGDREAATLVCPLWLEPLAVARPSGGALVIAGRREILTASRDALEVLAGQAALALDRILLVEAISRRDSDDYLRAVVRNTADMMLVIDDDQRVRYASPALRRLLDMDELPPLTTLRELVAPADRTQVRQALQGEGDGVLFCAFQRGDGQHVLVEATYRDLREDRLVRGFVVTVRDITKGHEPGEQVPHLDHLDELPAWVNRRSAQHKFRY